jgi:hypothetical protein
MGSDELPPVPFVDWLTQRKYNLINAAPVCKYRWKVASGFWLGAD